MILYYHITKCESTTKAHPQETNIILSQDEWAFSISLLFRFQIIYMQKFVASSFQDSIFVELAHDRIFAGAFNNRRFVCFIHSGRAFLFDGPIAKWLTGTADTSIWTRHNLDKIKMFFTGTNLFKQIIRISKTIYNADSQCFFADFNLCHFDTFETTDTGIL